MKAHEKIVVKTQTVVSAVAETNICFALYAFARLQLQSAQDLGIRINPRGNISNCLAASPDDHHQQVQGSPFCWPAAADHQTDWNTHLQHVSCHESCN